MEQQTVFERPDKSQFPSLSNTLSGGFNPPRVTPLDVVVEARVPSIDVTDWKVCNQKSCHMAGQLQPPSSYHKGSGICKVCKQGYDAKHKAAKTAGILKNERRATAPEKDVCLVRANGRINGFQGYYLMSDQDIKEQIIKGNIKSGDVIIRAKTVSRRQLRFEMVDI